MIAVSPPLTPSVFGHLSDGTPVEARRLANEAGASMQIIALGGVVTHLRMPDRWGRPADIVLGFDALAPYLVRGRYFGAVVGRVAGRITGGKFDLEGETYQLAVNNGPNHLHGGSCGFDKKLWHAEPLIRPDGADSLRLTLHSADGDEGYPGNVDASVTYTLTDDNELLFETEVTSDRPTPASLTTHSFFNLAGEDAGPVLGHEVQIFADAYAPVDEHMTLLGRAPVDGLACDLRQPRRLGDVLKGLAGAHGAHYFIDHPLPPADRAPRLVATVREPGSGRVLEVFTTEDGIQFYTGSYLDGSLHGKSGAPYVKHQGLCLECQGYPNAVNAPELGDIIVRPGQPRRHTTIYKFSTE